MTEPTPTHRPRRPRRSTYASQLLETLRKANAEQRAEYLAREQRVEEALEKFVDAAAEIRTVEDDRAKQVDKLQRKIDAINSRAQKKVGTAKSRQATAALVIHQSDRTVEQVSETLRISEREARRLIGAGRKAVGDDRSQTAPGSGGGAGDPGAESVLQGSEADAEDSVSAPARPASPPRHRAGPADRARLHADR